jgi:hypothetical protein
VGDLLGGAALVDGRQGEEAGQAGGGRAAVDPGQLEGCQRQGQVLGPGDEAALFRLHECGGDAGAVEGFKHLGLGGGPLVGVALAGGDQAGHGAAGHVRADWTSICRSKRSAKRHWIWRTASPGE